MQPSPALTTVLVVGAGSLGSVYGGLLAAGGADVQLLARKPHARAIEEAGGLVLESGDERTLVPLRAHWQGERLDPAEVVIVLTKTPDTASALDAVAHLVDAVDVAVSLQNGVDKNDILARWCGPQRVVGGVSMVGGTLLQPGVARHTLPGVTFLGALPSGIDEGVTRLASLFERSGLPVVVSDRIQSVEWSKLVHSIPSMAITALTRRSYHEIFLAPELARVYLDLCREGAAAAASVGADLDDWPHLFPVRTVASADDETALAQVAAHGHRLEQAGMTQIRISMLQSVERERKTEYDAILGPVVRAAQAAGFAVPNTDLCYRLLAGMDRYYR